MSGVKLTKLQAIRAAKLRSSKSFPDLAIYEPRDSFSGLFIELKADGVRILKKDGKTYANEHIEEQHKMLQKLLLKGYFAVFAVGFEAAKQVIDEYLKL